MLHWIKIQPMGIKRHNLEGIKKEKTSLKIEDAFCKHGKTKGESRR